MSKIKMHLNMYISAFRKRDKKIWIFGAWLGSKFADNSKYLFLEALREGINATWITENREVYNKLKQKGLPVEMQSSKRGIELQKKAGYAICCVKQYDFDEQYLGGCTIVNLDHGVALKKGSFDDRITNTQPMLIRLFKAKILRGFCFRKYYTIVTSSTYAEIYRKMLRTRKKKIIECGYPRNDIFFKENYKDEFDFSFLGDKKMITYMPTHRKEGKKPFEFNKTLELKKINEICQSNNYLFVIKKHFYHRNEKTCVDNYSNIIDITNTQIDPQELLRHTDVLISDYSGAYIDYLLLDRPIIFYNYDYQDYLKNDRDMYFEYDDVTPGPKISDKRELTKAIQQICDEGKDEYNEDRKRCLGLFFDEKKKPCASELIQIIKKI